MATAVREWVWDEMKNRYLWAEMNMTKQAMEINYVDRLKLTRHQIFLLPCVFQIWWEALHNEMIVVIKYEKIYV